jgi:hypothetical protein
VIDDVSLQRMWMALQKRSWRTVAIVPLTRHASTLEVANTLAELCWTCRGESAVALDMRGTGLRLLDQHKKHIEEHVKKGSSVVLALPAVQESPIAVTLARLCDAALMVVRLDETPIAAAKQAIEEIGQDRFVGAILASTARVPEVVPLFQRSTLARATIKMLVQRGRT